MAGRHDGPSPWRLTVGGTTFAPPTVSKAGNGYWMKPDEARTEYQRKRNQNRSWGTLDAGKNEMAIWMRDYMAEILPNVERVEYVSPHERKWQMGYHSRMQATWRYRHHVWGMMHLTMGTSDWYWETNQEPFVITVSVPNVFRFNVIEPYQHDKDDIIWKWSRDSKDIPLNFHKFTMEDATDWIENPGKVFDKLRKKMKNQAPILETLLDGFDPDNIEVLVDEWGPEHWDGIARLTCNRAFFGEFATDSVASVLPDGVVEALQELGSLLSAKKGVSVSLDMMEDKPLQFSVATRSVKDENNNYVRHAHTVRINMQTGNIEVACGYEEDDDKFNKWQRRAAAQLLNELNEEAAAEEDAQWEDFDLSDL